jgi:D-alanine transaminase
MTAATQIVLPIVRIDGRTIGEGRPGLIATAMRHDFHRHAEVS